MSIAACVATVQANLMMNTVGKTSDSFVVLDLMRLPLGILSGVGFIGAGVILKRDNIVRGVTTAATMWFVTVMGLCFGGGQIKPGLSSFTIALFTLTAMKWIEDFFPTWHPASLPLILSTEVLTEDDLRATLKNAGMKISSWAVDCLNPKRARKITCELKWKPKHVTLSAETPNVIEALAHHAGVAELEWKG